MEQVITEFIHSETGFIVAVVFIVLGLSDLASAYYIFKYKPDILPALYEKYNQFMIVIYFLSSLMVLIGFYMLYIRL